MKNSYLCIVKEKKRILRPAQAEKLSKRARYFFLGRAQKEAKSETREKFQQNNLKVIREAALRSDVSQGVMKAYWDAADEVIKA